jgi:CreA protein
MTNRKSGLRAAALVAALMLAGLAASPGRAADEPDLIFRRSTVFKWLTPNDRLATYGLDDPEVDGIACHFTVPEKGGLKGWLGVAEEVSDISLACRQIAPIRFKKKFAQGEDVFRTRRSLFFKKMQIVRGCDTKRNVLVYMVYSDRLIEGSPKNSSAVGRGRRGAEMRGLGKVGTPFMLRRRRSASPRRQNAFRRRATETLGERGIGEHFNRHDGPL